MGAVAVAVSAMPAAMRALSTFISPTVRNSLGASRARKTIQSGQREALHGDGPSTDAGSFACLFACVEASLNQPTPLWQ